MLPAITPPHGPQLAKPNQFSFLAVKPTSLFGLARSSRLLSELSALPSRQNAPLALASSARSPEKSSLPSP
jgi:hypothetical protein